MECKYMSYGSRPCIHRTWNLTRMECKLNSFNHFIPSAKPGILPEWNVNRCPNPVFWSAVLPGILPEWNVNTQEQMGTAYLMILESSPEWNVKASMDFPFPLRQAWNLTRMECKQGRCRGLFSVSWNLTRMELKSSSLT